MKYCDTPKPYFECDEALQTDFVEVLPYGYFYINIICIGCVHILLYAHSRYCVPSTSRAHVCSECTRLKLIHESSVQRIIYTNYVKSAVECGTVTYRYLMFQ